MSGSPGIVTPSPAGRRLLSPLSSAEGRNTAELLSPSNDGVLKENLDTTNLDGSKPSTISMPIIDSCILGKETLEERDKFTLYKIEVNDGAKSWIIYRRYRDFVLLNKKLRRLYPQFRLNLPQKRFFKDNFAKDFIERRQRGLEEFTRNLFCHRDLVFSDVVQIFYRLNNPPQPNENLEASRNFCQSLERQLADIRQQFREQSAEYNAVKIELAQVKYCNQDNQDPVSNPQKLQDDFEITIKGLKDQLTTAVENEKRAQDELEVLKEEISAERASVQASRIIEMQKRELAVNKQIETFNKSQEALNKRIDSLAVAMGQLSKVQVEIAGRKLEVDASDDISEQAVHLKEALNESRSQLKKIHLDALEMYKQEVEDLKTEFSRVDFLAKARAQETYVLKTQMSDLQKRYQDGIRAQDDYISQLSVKFSDLQRYAVTTEEKYFYSLVIGVKLNMAVCGYRVDHINHLKPQKLFEQVRNRGISIEHWPSWLSRELSNESATPDHEDED